MNNNSLRIVADANIWGARQAFTSLVGLDVALNIMPHHDITANKLKQIDILLTRSGTQVNESLLHGSPVRFVGTATIGDDHVDKFYLQSQNITFTSAAGSSTESVVEYMLAAFFALEQQNKLNFSQDKLGIIGVGRIGSLLNKACDKLDFTTILNDPPRALEASLDDVLTQADILTLHTPLAHHGEHATHHLLDKKALSKFKGKGIINAGRGACLDNIALLDWLNQDAEHFAVLDCWEHEPTVNMDLLKHPQVLISTPHIAGHSLDGKAANTYYVYKDLCHFLELSPNWDMQAALPDIASNTLAKHLSKTELALTMYPIQDDTQAMKKAAHQAGFKAWFAGYRKNYPVRRSWPKVLAMHAYAKHLFF